MTEAGFTVRLANLQQRAVLLGDEGCWDVERESMGRFSSDPMELLAEWDELRDWCQAREFGAPSAYEPPDLGPCVPTPGQIFAIGLNYRDHADESGQPAPKYPMVFTKFRSCLTGPYADVVLPSGAVDWEVELVVVIGREATGVNEGAALDHVAGVCVGQDLSERRVQWGGEPAQFSLGKSFPGFGPIGPAVVALDSIDVQDLTLSCSVADVVQQRSSTAQMIFSAARLVSYLSSTCSLEPGDLIFTGTPDGIGAAMTPPTFLRPGDTVVSEISGLGRMENRCVERASPTLR